MDRDSALQLFLERLAGFRVLLLFVFHTGVFAAAYAFSYLIRFEFAIPFDYLTTFKSSLPVVIGIQLVVGVFFGFYRGWWRYVGIADVVRLVFGLTTALVILIGIWYLGTEFGVDSRYVKSPRGVLLVDWAFALLALFGSRVAIRLGRDRLRPASGASGITRRVLIVGAGDAGETLAREIEHRPQLGMKVVGFVDDQRTKWGSLIRGIKVTGPIQNIGRLADVVDADEALIAIPSASGKRLREIIHHLAEADLSFRTMPGIDQLMSGKVHVSQLRPVNVEDLLRRQRIVLPGDPVQSLFEGKRILVTGGGGTIGSELAAQIAALNPERLMVVERSEYLLYEVRRRLARQTPWNMDRIDTRLVDIQDTEIMRQVLDELKPHIVLHAAAHKHVPLGEENPAEYVRNNTLATRSLGELCAESDVERFVFISSDKAINPTSVMGATKRAAEILLLDLAARSSMKVIAVRFGNVIGSSGSAVPLFLEQIAGGGPVTVTHPDVTRYFIRTSEAISLVLQAATLGSDGQIFMLDMGEPIRIADLARDLIRLSNHSEDEIPIVFTGLRPGEKLFEEIRLDGERVTPTVHPQIVVTEAPQPPAEAIERWTRTLRTAVDANRDDIISVLQERIPEFVPATKQPPTVAEQPAPILTPIHDPMRA
jgi:FlaA1/EpsC-like NDP-sugar epimerase